MHFVVSVSVIHIHKFSADTELIRFVLCKQIWALDFFKNVSFQSVSSLEEGLERGCRR